MARLPEPPRDASGLPVEGYVRRMVWGILFTLASVGVLLGAAGDHWRADWVLMSAPVFVVGFLILFLARRHRRRTREIYSLGREVEAEIAQMTTVYRNGLIVCWLTTFRLKETPDRELKIGLSLNPAGTPMTLLLQDDRAAVYGEFEKIRMFHVGRLSERRGES